MTQHNRNRTHDSTSQPAEDGQGARNNQATESNHPPHDDEIYGPQDAEVFGSQDAEVSRPLDANGDFVDVFGTQALQVDPLGSVAQEAQTSTKEAHGRARGSDAPLEGQMKTPTKPRNRSCAHCKVAKVKCGLPSDTDPSTLSQDPCGRCKERGLQCWMQDSPEAGPYNRAAQNADPSPSFTSQESPIPHWRTTRDYSSLPRSASLTRSRAGPSTIAAHGEHNFLHHDEGLSAGNSVLHRSHSASGLFFQPSYGPTLRSVLINALDRTDPQTERLAIFAALGVLGINTQNLSRFDAGTSLVGPDISSFTQNEQPRALRHDSGTQIDRDGPFSTSRHATDMPESPVDLRRLATWQSALTNASVPHRAVTGDGSQHCDSAGACTPDALVTPTLTQMPLPGSQETTSTHPSDATILLVQDDSINGNDRNPSETLDSIDAHWLVVHPAHFALSPGQAEDWANALQETPSLATFLPYPAAGSSRSDDSMASLASVQLPSSDSIAAHASRSPAVSDISMSVSALLDSDHLPAAFSRASLQDQDTESE